MSCPLCGTELEPLCCPHCTCRNNPELHSVRSRVAELEKSNQILASSCAFQKEQLELQRVAIEGSYDFKMCKAYLEHEIAEAKSKIKDSLHMIHETERLEDRSALDECEDKLAAAGEEGAREMAVIIARHDKLPGKYVTFVEEAMQLWRNREGGQKG